MMIGNLVYAILSLTFKAAMLFVVVGFWMYVSLVIWAIVVAVKAL